MTDLVPQRTPNDCAICCLAMLTGTSYDGIMMIVDDAFDPDRGMINTSIALERLGFSGRFENGHAAGDFVDYHRMYSVSHDYFREFTWGRRALVSIMSLNEPCAFHMIYWDGHEVFDPSTRERVTAWCDLQPESLILFPER